MFLDKTYKEFIFFFYNGLGKIKNNKILKN